MGKLLKQYWLSNRRAIFSAFILTILLAAGFLAYLKFVGIPRTQARNLYNQAQLLLAEDKTAEAKEILVQAQAFWPEDYILEALSELH